MSLPSWAHRRCQRCPETIAYVRSNRTSGGAPLEIPINLEGDRHGSIFVQATSDVMYGSEVAKSKRAAMVAAGQVLYHPHSTTCKGKGKPQT